MDDSRDEIIQILMEGNEPSKQQSKIVSIVGTGGLGKTSLANAVYEKLRAQLDYCAFVSVSQTPDMIFKCMLNDFGEKFNTKTQDEGELIKQLREFLQNKRYFIVIDDIWDIMHWKIIKYALPDNNDGYKIITTSRILQVAEHAGGTYKMKPLSLNNSRKLLYRRIFGNKNKDNNDDKETCPDKDLAEVCDRILKKCASVPLAIITMARVLAYKVRNKMDWYEVYNSVGTGLENSLDVENMRKVLSFSYYDLPSHLRTCLLYLSVFPEDYEINKDRLIWMWIAEGFIQCEKREKNLFDLGESYFNELINRSMIQPIHEYADMIYGCRVHDMVLDLICSLSTEENFVTALNGMEHISSSNIIQRLSLQNGKEDDAATVATRSLQQVRSVVVFPSAIRLLPTLRSFQVIRVLDLQGCDLLQGCSLKYVDKLFHLRYLGLGDTRIAQLPEEIGNIRFLQTLDLMGTSIYSLPSTVVQLRHLMCLYIESYTRLPNGIGSLTSLEELLFLCIDDDSTADITHELGQLTGLRVLSIVLFSDWNDKLLECLCKLQKIQNLYIEVRNGRRNIGGLDAWVAPPHLRILNTRWGCWLSTVQTWMNRPLLLLDLSFLSIAMRELEQAHLDILGRLPALRYLDLEVDHEDLGILGGFVVSAGSFPCLARCGFGGFVGPVVFEHGAMPSLRTLHVQFSVREARESPSSDGGSGMGLGNLPSLQDVWVYLNCEGASNEEVKDLKVALRHSVEISPNHPRLHIY